MTYSAMLSIFIEKYYVKKNDKIEEDVMESEYFQKKSLLRIKANT